MVLWKFKGRAGRRHQILLYYNSNKSAMKLFVVFFLIKVWFIESLSIIQSGVPRKAASFF